MNMLRHIVRGLVVASLFSFATFAQSQLTVPLHFGVKQALTDEFGQMLPGTATAPGAIVQILSAESGIFPPDTQGNPHPNNRLLSSSHIGKGTDPTVEANGRVAGSVSINRSQATPIFARVFNRSTPEDSSFFADSQIFTNSTTTYGVFYIQAVQTTNELDSADDDGDGLSNSWEKSMGTDSLNPDTDGDGVIDGHEVLAGTNPLDESDFLQMVQLKSLPNGQLVVLWDSVMGKTYQVQYTTNSLTDESAFTDINSPVVASDIEASTIVTNPPANSSFRVKLLLNP